MRKSQPSTGARPWRAGLVVAAAAATAVAGLAAPAYAADVAVTVTPTQVVTGSVITFTGTNVLSGITAPGGRFVASTGTCPATYDGTSGGTAASTLTKTDANGGTITVPSGLTAAAYKICLYANATTGAIAGHSSSTVTVVNSGTFASPGPTGGGTQTFTGTGLFTSVTGTIGVTFTAAATSCPDKYTPTSTSATVITGTAARSGNNTATVTVPSTLVAGTNYQVCLYNGTTSGSSALLARATTTYTVAAPIVISPRNGPAGGGYSITVAAATANSLTSSGPGVTFTTGSCTSTYTDGGGSADPWAGVVTKISNSKVAVAVPAGVTTTDPTATYSVCLYNGTSGTSPLLGAPAILTIAPALSFGTVLVSVNGATAGALPGSGPAQGNTLVAFSGITGLPTQAAVDAGATLSASLGGSPITDLEVTDTDEITGYTSAHAAGNAKLTVTTAAGSVQTTADAFTFSYGITTQPSTAPSTATAVTLDILGSGFGSLTYSSSAEATGSTTPGGGAGVGVYLVTNGWYAAATGTGSNGVKVWVTGLITQCTGVTKISDNEMICTLNLTKSFDGSFHYNTGAVPDGVYNVAVVNDASLTTTLQVDVNVSRISSGSVFTVANY